MTFLPIVARELRVASRQRATYWSRTITAMLGIVIGAILFIQFREQPPHELGQILFIVISVLAFLYCLLAGVRSTADCLSEEKREGTLGLLFLTDLKGYDVVGGKLVATSLNAFYGLMAVVPLLAVPLLMGGITNGEFWRTALVLMNTFLFSLATGMFLSSISKYPRKAIAGTFLVLLFFSLGLPLLRNWVPWIYNTPRADFVIRLFEPSHSIWLVADVNYLKLSKEFWWSVGTIQALCWLFLGLASFIVPRSWQDNPPGTKGRRWRQRWQNLNYGDASERLAFRRRLLGINAFFWLTARARLKPAHVWVGFVIVAGFWTWGALEQGKQWVYEFGVHVVTALVINTMLKLWIASEAGRRLGEDRKLGALELLLSTPLGVPEILRGQFLALKRQFLGPLIFALAVECIFMVAGLHGSGIDGDAAPGYFSFWIAGMIMLVMDSLALSTVGMWVGLTAKNPNRATSITVARVLILPLAVGFIIFIAAALIAYNSSGFEPGWKFMLILWFGLGIATDAIFGLGAWRKLQTGFREVATQRFAAAPSVWGRLFRGGARPQ
jgi:ABC-type Na+ efflux pump permease subunit